MHHPKLEEIVRRDGRYAYEAYEFVFAALAFTQHKLGRQPPERDDEGQPQHHVTGPELLDGVRELALNQFGLLARTVLRCWGVERTDDFGEIVFNLVEARLMSKTDEDSRADFHAIYDMDQALVQDFRIELDDQSFWHEYRTQPGDAG
jgi:uncharacterized repeat protein (TIGR04138 family)